MLRVCITFVLLILFLAFCSKPNDIGTKSRTNPNHPEGFSIDTTWLGDTTIYFNP